MNIKIFFALIVQFAPVIFATAQPERNFYVAVNNSLMTEKRSAMIYGTGLEKRTSNTLNVGGGLKAIYVRNALRFGAGLSVVRRNYEMIRPFDHCHFNEPGQPCDFILAHVDEYSYATVEFPLSIDVNVFVRGRFKYFVGATYTNALVYNSKYHAYYPKIGTKQESSNFTRFSESFYGQIAVTYSINKRLQLNLQPFIRVRCRQQQDQVLMEDSDQTSSFDSIGLLTELYFRLGQLNNCATSLILSRHELAHPSKRGICVLQHAHCQGYKQNNASIQYVNLLNDPSFTIS